MIEYLKELLKFIIVLILYIGFSLLLTVILLVITRAL